MNGNYWDAFFSTGKVDDYLRYRAAEDGAVPPEENGRVRVKDKADGAGAVEVSTALLPDVELRYAGQDRRRGPESTKL